MFSQDDICLNCAAHSLPDVVCSTRQEKGGREKIRKREEEEEEEKEKSQRRKRKRELHDEHVNMCLCQMHVFCESEYLF